MQSSTRGRTGRIELGLIPAFRRVWIISFPIEVLHHVALNELRILPSGNVERGDGTCGSSHTRSAKML